VDWAGETYEKGESQSFWTEFLEVFGINRRRAGGYFEYAVKLDRRSGHGFIDMFLPGRLLAEQKSAGRDLTKATGQALEYLDGLDDHDLPRLIVACDFATFEVMDLDSREVTKFELANLPRFVELFAPMFGEVSSTIVEEQPVNRQAAEVLAKLHQRLKADGFVGRKLELFLVRIVFCLFAEDSFIFERDQFTNFIKQRTSESGTDIGPLLGKLFTTLNTDPQDRSHALDPELAAFRYINGGLFADVIEMPDFDAPLRLLLLSAARVDWSQVSPAIFGAMFQGVLEDDERHDLGAHYTSEENILKVIKPLFLDDLYAEFQAANALSDSTRAARRRKPALDVLHDKIASLRFLDPACGCGNFLVIAYRELRRLEHRIVKATLDNTSLLDLNEVLRVRVEQFSGIEIEDSAQLIAKTAMWLTDHQMNREASLELAATYTRLPLTDGANIVRGNALTLDWADVVDPAELDYIIGNPPFLGSRIMDATQKKELRAVARGYPQAGFLDYVAGWYILADRMMEANPDIETALVSTNSISQGEQPGILWPVLYERGNHINFAHRTFRWTNAARGVAHVHCVVVGFSRKARAERSIYYYPDITGEPVLKLATTILPYLIDGEGDEWAVSNREEQVSGQPRMAFGNMAADGGNLLLSPSERDELVAAEAGAAEWILPAVGSVEFLQGQERYCLWLDGITPAQLRALPRVRARVAANQDTRSKSSRPELAKIPHLFAQRTVDPHAPFLLVPRASSQSRAYVPMGFFEGGVVATDACLAIAGADAFLFGILTSEMHMAWLRVIGGRLKSDYRYSKDIVYNNFVFPEADEDQRTVIATLAGYVLDARAAYAGSTPADLYDPVTMPADLWSAHKTLDTHVECLYRMEPFVDDEDRARHLLRLHRDATLQA